MTAATFDANLFADKSVLVVGGTSGLGAAIATAFLRHGARATITGGASRDEVSAAQTIARSGAEALVLDVRDTAAISTIIDAMSQLDILINCAGIIRRNREHDPAVFAEVLEINLTGTMRLCTAARPLLARSGGSIVNTASMLSFFGGGMAPGYSASKGGIAQLTKSLAIAYAPDRIRVNALAPGWITTALTEPLQHDAERSAAILARTPLARWGTPEDVAGAALFLCSPAAQFITGVILPVDGGYLVS